jgi:large subunit ribosomal protein L28
VSRICQVTGKGVLYGNTVSHSNRKSRSRQAPNLRWKRFWSTEDGRWYRLRVSAAGIREITKRGFAAVLKDLRAAGQLSR